MAWQDIGIWSYSQRAIWIGVFGLVGVGLALALLVAGRGAPPPAVGEGGVLQQPELNFGDDPADIFLPAAQVDADSEASMTLQVLRAAQQRQVPEAVLYYLQLLLIGEAAELAVIEADASASPPRRYANRALAAHYASIRDWPRALAAVRREGESFAEADAARRQALRWAYQLNDFEALTEMARQPRYLQGLPPAERLRLAVVGEHLPGILGNLLPAQYSHTQMLYTFLALIAGLVWLAVLWLAGSGESPQRLALPLLLLAGTGLGVVSTWLTIVAVIYTEERLGFTMGSSDASITLYMIFGVGLREELLKLLCVVPLVPILLWRARPLEWLLVSGAVGLGFAIEENISYYLRSSGRDIGGRFLSANILHVALTGITGYTLLQALRWPRAAGGQFLLTLTAAVLAHGFYNAFQAAPLLAEYSLVSLAILIGVTWYFFQTLRGLRPQRQPTISLSAAFCWGFVGLLMLSLGIFSYLDGFQPALRTAVPDVAGICILVIIVLRGIGDRLHA